MMLLVALLGLLLTTDAILEPTVDPVPETPRPMPPFVLLKPPTFKAGHTVSQKLCVVSLP